MLNHHHCQSMLLSLSLWLVHHKTGNIKRKESYKTNKEITKQNSTTNLHPHLFVWVQNPCKYGQGLHILSTSWITFFNLNKFGTLSIIKIAAAKPFHPPCVRAYVLFWGGLKLLTFSISPSVVLRSFTILTKEDVIPSASIVSLIAWLH